MKLQNRTVLVTGGSKGIGWATVEAMAEQGADIIINYRNDKEAAEKAADSARKYGVQASIVRADITKQSDVNAMFSAIKRDFSSLDVLVNNASVFDEDDNPENIATFENQFNASLLSQIRVTNAACKLMKQGKVIFVSSIHGKLGHGSPNAIAYSATKAALDSYMKNLAKALAPDILVNAVSPGRTLTPMWGQMSEEYKAKLAAGQLINRWIEPSEIADGIVFLAKNDAVCGEVLVIDGGMSLKTLG